MLSFSQLEFSLASRLPARPPGRDPALEALARDLLLQQGAPALAARVVVEWSSRLRTAAGRAEYRLARVLLNCRLCAHGEEEIDRTLRHELAHLLARSRAGRRRVAPHGAEWRRACAGLGIPDETRCHNLPFPTRRLERRYLYVCVHCRREFPRTRLLRRTSACLACCRAFNHGRYDRRFRLQLVRRAHATRPAAAGAKATRRRELSSAV
ncbi:MAG: SprT-like domain-containing protein [Spartobacteria bacterium]